MEFTIQLDPTTKSTLTKDQALDQILHAIREHLGSEVVMDLGKSTRLPEWLTLTQRVRAFLVKVG